MGMGITLLVTLSLLLALIWVTSRDFFREVDDLSLRPPYWGYIE